MASAVAVLNWAASQIGVKENPSGSNRVKYWDYYREHCGKNYNGSPWCAAFVTNGMSVVGAWGFTSDEGRFRYCPSLVNWAKQNGQWVARDNGAKAGDIVLFANSKGVACHVGFVEKVLSSTKVQTIEGNTSVTSNDNGGAVMRRTREYGKVGSSWYILGFVRTPWSGSSAPSNTGKKSNDEIAQEVIDMKWGVNPEREKRLTAAGYNAAEIQRLVNIKLGAKPSTSKPAATTSGYSTGTYQVQVSSFLRVRTGAGTGFRAKTKSEVSADARKHWKGTEKDGGLANGTRMTVSEIKNTSNEVWGKIPSGWICIKQNGSTFAKRV